MLTVEGQADSKAVLLVIPHRFAKGHKPLGAAISSDSASRGANVTLDALDTAHEDAKAPMGMQLHFPPGEGWKTISVTINW